MFILRLMLCFEIISFRPGHVKCRLVSQCCKGKFRLYNSAGRGYNGLRKTALAPLRRREKRNNATEADMEKNRRLICENWLFAKTEDPAAVTPGYWEEAFGRVTLPHDWQVFNPRTPDAHGSGAQGYFPREEVGVYRWHFTADKAWKGKLVRVLFDGVQRFCEEYLNGEKIASQKYGYIPFIAVLKKLNYGKDNLLAIGETGQERH